MLRALCLATVVVAVEPACADGPAPLTSVDETLRKAVRRSFVVHEPETTAEPKPGLPRYDALNPSPRTAQAWLEMELGKWIGLNYPTWEVRKPLDVDLCFALEIQEVKTGKVYAAGEVRVLRGSTGRGSIIPTDLKAFTAGRDGFVPIKVVMRPSRAVALADPRVVEYFPDPFTSVELEMKIIRPRPVTPDK